MLSGKNIWRLVAAFAFLNLAGGLAAQPWSTGTGYIYCPDTGSGNVGIGPGFSGAVAPVATLDVKGTAHVSGRVGIGTTANPTNMLHVYSTAVADGLAIDGTSSPAITFKNAGDAKGYIGFPTQQGNYFDGAAANDLIIRSEGSSSSIHLGRCWAAPTLTASGPNVSIANSAPNHKVHFTGNIHATRSIIRGTPPPALPYAPAAGSPSP